MVEKQRRFPVVNAIRAAEALYEDLNGLLKGAREAEDILAEDVELLTREGFRLARNGCSDLHGLGALLTESEAKKKLANEKVQTAFRRFGESLRRTKSALRAIGPDGGHLWAEITAAEGTGMEFNHDVLNRTSALLAKLHELQAAGAAKPAMPGRRARIALEEATQIARDWLPKHPNATVRELHKATGISLGMIPKLTPWKAHMALKRKRQAKGAASRRESHKGRKAREKAERRTEREEEILELVREQEQDAAAEKRGRIRYDDATGDAYYDEDKPGAERTEGEG